MSAPAADAFTLATGPAAPVALVTAPSADCGRERDQVEAWCAAHELELDVLRVGQDGTGRRPWQLVVALGGDGTILRALRLAGPVGAPVLGVNLGRVGFLADAQPGDLAAALAAVADGRARVERRAALQVAVRDGAALDEHAYNDVVFGRRAGHGSARIAVQVNGTPVVSLVGDGVIVASALGSTAYTVSAGGPAISPPLDAMVLTPVAAHTGPLRSLVLSADDELCLIAGEDSAPLTIEIDGRTASEVPPGARVHVGRWHAQALLLRTTPDTFFEHLRDRLLTR
ncbi:MAG TPA: NAD(+)/NADH kinase [Solirubrobacteraceae bacterium]|nr:NAD(+)/NADH kinase [Solirubrobacteraceae bacterium]